MQNLKRSFPWLIVGLVIVSSLINSIFLLSIQAPSESGPVDIRLYVGLLTAMFLVALAFAVVGALIVTRRPGHLVGWLLLFVGISNANPIPSILEVYFPAAPAVIFPGLWLLLWFNGWAWSVGILLIFLILLNFPTGRPPSRRWRWLNFLAPAMILYLAVLNVFVKDLGPANGWRIENPVGIITDDRFNLLVIPFYITLLIFIVGCIAAIIVRSRRRPACGCGRRREEFEGLAIDLFSNMRRV